MTMRDQLRGYEEQFEPGYMNGVENRLPGGICVGGQLQISPQIVGKHHNLEVGHIGLKVLRRNRSQSFTFGLSNQIFRTGSQIIFGNRIVRRLSGIGHKGPIPVSILLKQRLLAGVVFQALWNAHGDKAAGTPPTLGLVHTLIVLDPFRVSRAVPTVRIKRRRGSLDGNREVKAFFHTRLYGVPAEEFRIRTDPGLFYTARKQGAQRANEFGALCSAHRFPSTKLSAQIFFGLRNKGQNRSETLLAAGLGVVAFSGPFDLAVDRLYGGVDIDVNPLQVKAQRMPGPLPERCHDPHQRMGLVDPYRLHIPPERTDMRKPADPQQPQEHWIFFNVNEMIDPLEPDKQQQDKPLDEEVAPRTVSAPGFYKHCREKLLKLHPVQELLQWQQTAIWTQMLFRVPIGRRRPDFYSFFQAFLFALFYTPFLTILLLRSNHLGSFRTQGVETGEFHFPLKIQGPKWFFYLWAQICRCFTQNAGIRYQLSALSKSTQRPHFREGKGWELIADC